MERVGFPWAEVAGDGSSVIGKHDGTGGEVSVGTVVSQLLYEIGGPAYLGPDVTARFDTITAEQLQPDRVLLNGTKVADVRDDTSRSGRIGFQVHAGTEFGEMRVFVRKVTLLPL